MDGKEGLSELGARVNELLAEDPRAAGELREARAGFLDEMHRRNAPPSARALVRRARLRWTVLLLGAVAATAGAVILLVGERPLTFAIGEAHEGLVGDRVEAPPGRTVPVAFSEGSSVVLHDSGRLRVLSLGKGARRVSVRILLEAGALDASISHRPGVETDWRFDAGPYQVTVTGTKFRMQLGESQRSLRVSTDEGRVVLSGGCLQSPVAIAAGGNFETSCPASVAAKEPSASEAAPRETPPAEEPAPEPGLRSRSPSSHTHHWRELLAAGRLEEGLRAAEQASFARVCQMATSKELLALADGGRFFGPYPRAVAALTALRRRFPGTAEAGTAAFTLGRIAFENEAAYGRAAQWFDTYLQEQPSGPLMGDAFGRLVEARLRAGDRTGARATAEQYLRRFPGGPYASEARGILSK